MARHLCLHIMEHLASTFTFTNVAARASIDAHTTSVRWFLDVLEKSQINQEYVSYPMVVHHIRARKPASITTMIREHTFHLHNLEIIAPSVLTKLVATILRCCLAATGPIITMTGANVTAGCADKITTVIKDLGRIFPPLTLGNTPDFETVVVRFEFLDNQNQTVVIWQQKDPETYPTPGR